MCLCCTNICITTHKKLILEARDTERERARKKSTITAWQSNRSYEFFFRHACKLCVWSDYFHWMPPRLIQNWWEPNLKSDSFIIIIMPMFSKMVCVCLYLDSIFADLSIFHLLNLECHKLNILFSCACIWIARVFYVLEFELITRRTWLFELQIVEHQERASERESAFERVAYPNTSTEDTLWIMYVTYVLIVDNFDNAWLP